MPIKTPSSSTPDLHPPKLVSPGSSLVLYPVIDADKYEALCVQLKIFRLNGVYALDFIKSVVGTVDELGLKPEIKDLQD